MKVYLFFHLNLIYSSIEEEQRADVIRRCYRPLLDAIEQVDIPVGIEASAVTLEAIQQADPRWIEEFSRLAAAGRCEFIGSGYAQLIGPLVPAEVNASNLRLGHEAYERILGLRPALALVNEQAYSAGLIQHYIDAGYRAIIMEWDNPAHNHPEWKPEWRYLPQVAYGQHGEEIPVIWNKSVAFQKFQRYAHGELELDEYLEYMDRHVADSPRAFPLYGNDAEIFGFRPGRYETETAVRDDEWIRIRLLLGALRADARFEFVLPISVLDLLTVPGAGNRLHLESPEVPVPVKKQEKYNLTRWSVTGRNDLAINTACWRLYEALKTKPTADNRNWRDICMLWGSDFRTHITEKRWKSYLDQLFVLEHAIIPASVVVMAPEGSPIPHSVQVSRKGRFLTVETEDLQVRLNCRRGLAVEALVFKKVSDKSLCGTLAHGYYDDISMAADFYTGHLVFEMPGLPKITDLESVEPEIKFSERNARVEVTANIKTALGLIRKTLWIPAQGDSVELRYALDWPNLPIGSLRLGAVTLNPAAFEEPGLFYRTHNGGFTPETFFLAGHTVCHGEAASLLVSAQHGLGVTERWVEIGDKRTKLIVEMDRRESALLGFVVYRSVGSSYFCRLVFSGREIDDTSHPVEFGRMNSSISVCIMLSARRNEIAKPEN